MKTRKAPTKPPTKKTGEMKFTQGLPGKSIGGTPFLNQKKVNLVIPETGGGEAVRLPWSYLYSLEAKKKGPAVCGFYCSKSDPKVYLQIWSFSSWMAHQKIGIWCPPAFLCTTSAKCFIGFRQQLQIHQHFRWCTGPLALPGPPPRPQKKHLMGSSGMSSSSSVVNGWGVSLSAWMEIHRFPKYWIEDSPSPEKNVPRDWKGFTFSWIPNHAWHLWSFMHFFIGSFSDSEWKTWGLSVGFFL